MVDYQAQYMGDEPDPEIENFIAKAIPHINLGKRLTLEMIRKYKLPWVWNSEIMGEIIPPDFIELVVENVMEMIEAEKEKDHKEYARLLKEIDDKAKEHA